MTERKTILIVDDQESIIKALKRLLLSEPYDIISAPDGAAALEMVKDHRSEIFLIISDQRMPNMTGTMFLEKSAEMIPDAVRFILSGYSDRCNGINSPNQVTAHRYISKPWDNDELLIMIKQAYEYPDRVRALVESGDDTLSGSPENNIMDVEIIKFGEQRKDRSLGRVAVHHGFINQKQLDESLTAMQSARQSGRRVSLENILFEKGFISSENLGKLIAVTRRKIGTTFGKSAIKEFGISPADIDRCLAIQAQEFSNTSTCRLLGDILVAEKILTEEQRDSIIVDMTFSEKELLNSDGDKSSSLQSGDTAKLQERIILNKKKKQLFRQRALDKIFCKSAMKRNMATEAEALKALEEQLIHFTKTFEIRFIKDILVERSIISQSQADTITASVGGFHPSQLRVAQTDTLTHPNMASATTGEPHMQVASIDKSPLQPSSDITQNSTGQKKITIGESNAFELTISAGEMEATIELAGDMPDSTTADQLKELLSKEHIVYGLADDVAIELFLRQAATKKAKLTVARGKPIKPGRNATIKYLFEDENSRFGKELESGKFDYRERGEIASVTQGTILAEKIPLIPPVNGMTICGDEIPAPIPLDMDLDCGKGVEISKDGLKAVAISHGRPDLSLGGKISVMPEKIIKGNVDFKIGNIKFGGDVVVQGTILAGFSVTANNITVGDIEEAEVHSTNTLFVKNCINDSKIRTGGALAAHIIKKSTVFASGDVVVQKEIIDSTITTSGRVIIPRGRIVASTIHAAKGIEAMNIGSELSDPCHLFPGADDHALDLLKIFSVRINSQSDHLAQLEAAKSQYEQQSLQQLTNLSEISKRQEELVMEKKKLLKEKTDSANSMLRKKIDESIAEIDNRAVKLDETINRLFDEQESSESKAKEVMAKIKVVKDKLKILSKEKNGFETWYEAQKREAQKSGVTGVVVQGTLFAGTHIVGDGCSKTVTSHIRNSRIHQVVNSDNPEKPFCEIRIDPLSSKPSQPHVYRT